MRIKDMPDNNRPRERFLKHGAEVLSFEFVRGKYVKGIVTEEG